MDTETGKIRPITPDDPLREHEIEITERIAQRLGNMAAEFRLEEYNRMVNTRQVRRSKKRHADHS